jgi:hypothetical protein
MSGEKFLNISPTVVKGINKNVKVDGVVTSGGV